MKKIVCINNSKLKDQLLPGQRIKSFLTKGKIYDVVEESTTFYTIVNDNGELMRYFEERFVTLQESRKLKLQKIDKFTGKK